MMDVTDPVVGGLKKRRHTGGHLDLRFLLGHGFLAEPFPFLALQFIQPFLFLGEPRTSPFLG
jgi:hypothetical protein